MLQSFLMKVFTFENSRLPVDCINVYILVFFFQTIRRRRFEQAPSWRRCRETAGRISFDLSTFIMMVPSCRIATMIHSLSPFVRRFMQSYYSLSSSRFPFETIEVDFISRPPHRPLIHPTNRFHCGRCNQSLLLFYFSVQSWTQTSIPTYNRARVMLENMLLLPYAQTKNWCVIV